MDSLHDEDGRNESWLSSRRVTSRPLAVVLIILALIAGYGAIWLAAPMGSFIPKLFAPGSGGSAQMLLAIVVIPVFALCVGIAIGAVAVIFACVRMIVQSYGDVD
jgi:hypothetical protein